MMPMWRVDERLKEYATEAQCRYIDAINEHKSICAAARALGMNPSTVNGGLRAVKRKAAMFGMSPEHDMTKTVPEPFVVRGVSTYYNKEGKPSGQWVKSALDEDKAKEAVQAALAALLVHARRRADIAA